ncbi:WD40 repeat-like protein [Martensiomyces pterosporus]|nr:WD40 repeat-like protein [Martensiomyces pterosporus]
MAGGGIVSAFHKLPVTVLEFLTDHHVLASSGGSLCVYETLAGKCIGRKDVFPYTRIYGIVPLKTTDRDSGTAHNSTVLVFGSKSWSVVDIRCDEKEAEISVIRQFEVDDWIKAGHWAKDPATSRWYVCLALAHNQVHICDSETGCLVHYAQCEEHCILYSAAFHGETLADLVVASGTVFNQVLIWHAVAVSSGEMCLNPAKAGQPDRVILHRLRGHDGVIFCVRISHDGQEVASVSDDRTMRLWRLHPSGPDSAAVLYGHQARIWSCLVLDRFLISCSEDGTCRVWERRGDRIAALDVWSQCKKNVWSIAVNPSGSSVVSGGSDGSIRMWSLQSAVGKRVESDDMLTPLEPPSPDMYLPSDCGARSSNEHIRGFALTGWDSAVVAMDSGCVLLHDLELGTWTTLYHSPCLAGYSMVATLPIGELAAVGTLDGSVVLVSPTQRFQPTLRRLHPSAVRYLVLSTRGGNSLDLVTHDADGNILWSRISTGRELSWTVVAALSLPERSHLATAAVSQSLGWAAVGTTHGGLFIYDLPADLGGVPVENYRLESGGVPTLVPAVTWYQAHGKFTLSTIAIQPSDTPGSCTVLTGGRDGMLQKFTVDISSKPVSDEQTLMSNSQVRHGSAIKQKNVYTGVLENQQGASGSATVVVSRISGEKLSEGWVEQLIEHNGGLFAITFYRKRLVLVDLDTRSDVVSVVCGGAGRVWQAVFAEPGIRIGFIKKRLLLTYRLPTAVCGSSGENAVLVDGISSVDIRATDSILLEGPNGGRVVVASGGEDCFLRIHEYRCSDKDRQQFASLAQIRRHTSAIRCVEFAPSLDASDDHGGDGAHRYRYLFSAGAGCELRCWRVEFIERNGLLEASLVEWALAPLLDDDSDPRIMGISVAGQTVADSNRYFTVVAGYSDASIRVWRLDVRHHQFTCVAHDAARTHSHCILSVGKLVLRGSAERTLLFTGATNGQVAIWDISKFIVEGESRASGGAVCDQPADVGPAIYVCQGVHQSGVNSLDAAKCPEDNRFWVASGGDDNSIAVSEFAIDEHTGAVARSMAGSYANSHASSVQQVRFVDGMVCSVSTDQRIALWALARNEGTCSLDFELHQMAYTQVADPSSMDILRTPGKRLAFVAGIGVEALELRLE